LNRRSIGNEYELEAARRLEASGYRILEHNYRTHTGEIDLIAEDGMYLVFIEVKYRATGAFGTSLEAVDTRKQNRIRRTAQYYMASHGLDPDHTPVRFDVAGFDGGKFTLLKGAF
jgi:putative endonuclease